MSTAEPKSVSKTVSDYERQRGGDSERHLLAMAPELTPRQARRVRKKERRLS